MKWKSFWLRNKVVSFVLYKFKLLKEEITTEVTEKEKSNTENIFISVFSVVNSCISYIFEESGIYKTIKGINPRASPGPKYRPKGRGIIPSAFSGIVRLTNFNALRF
jgi:hypothetical protein